MDDLESRQLMRGTDTHNLTLGAFHREFGGTIPRRLKVIGVLALLGLWPFGFGLVWLMVTDPPPANADGIAAVMMTVGFLALGVLPLGLAVARRGLRLRVHEHGCVVLRGGNERQIPWTAIESIAYQAIAWRVNGIPTGTNVKCVLETASGRIVFTHFLDGAFELVQIIQSQTFEHLLRRARSSFDNGTSVSFGKKLAIDLAGIRKRNAARTLPWNEVQSVVMDTGAGCLTIRKRDQRWPWARLNLYAVPNAAVLVAMARERTAGPHGF